MEPKFIFCCCHAVALILLSSKLTYGLLAHHNTSLGQEPSDDAILDKDPIPMPSSLLKQAREPRYRYHYKEEYPDEDYVFETNDTNNNNKHQEGGEGDARRMSSFIHNDPNSNSSTVALPLISLTLTLLPLVTKSMNDGGATSTFLMLVLETLLQSIDCFPLLGKFLQPKCRYGTYFNFDTQECNSKLGDPCDDSHHSCGQHTECHFLKCSCRRGYTRSYNGMDCTHPDDLVKDKRHRSFALRSWRQTDNPENRAIECQLNASFSPMCGLVLKQLAENQSIYLAPSLILLLVTLVVTLVVIPAL